MAKLAPYSALCSSFNFSNPEIILSALSTIDIQRGKNLREDIHEVFEKYNKACSILNYIEIIYGEGHVKRLLNRETKLHRSEKWLSQFNNAAYSNRGLLILTTIARLQNKTPNIQSPLIDPDLYRTMPAYADTVFSHLKNPDSIIRILQDMTENKSQKSSSQNFANILPFPK